MASALRFTTLRPAAGRRIYFRSQVLRFNTPSRRFRSLDSSAQGKSSDNVLFRKVFKGSHKKSRDFIYPRETYLHNRDVRDIQILKNRADVREARKEFLDYDDIRFALVPTMGALHEGHLSLIEAAAANNEVVWVSIFLNPAQFGPTEDLATYPQTWGQDLAKIKEMNRHLKSIKAPGRVTAVFAPKVKTMYPGTQLNNEDPASQSFVVIDERLTRILEGAARPTFFRGVATVVMKLFNIIKPHAAYFGQKDIQQLAVLKRMRNDFMLDTKIRYVPIVRDAHGLALSSRNAYLGERRRRVALVLNKALKAAHDAYSNGKTSRDDILGAAKAVFNECIEEQRELPPSQQVKFEVEYISLANLSDLLEIDKIEDAGTVVLSGTIIMLPLEEPQENEELGLEGDTKTVRLLDNIVWNTNIDKKRK